MALVNFLNKVQLIKKNFQLDFPETVIGHRFEKQHWNFQKEADIEEAHVIKFELVQLPMNSECLKDPVRKDP